MKCKNCDREAVYDDGLCENCHRAAVENERVQVLSREERNSFRGKTIDADGSVHDSDEDNQTIFDTVFRSHEKQKENQNPHVHIYTTNRLPLRIKFAIGFILLCIVAVIFAALSLLVYAAPFIIGCAVIYFGYSIIKSIMH
jgi:hypothetical protein